MTSAHDAKAREIAERHGLICLVGHGVTSHEHTLCDCKVLEVIATALRDCEREAYKRAAVVAREMDYPEGLPEFTSHEEAWASACGHIFIAIRNLARE
jgi:hypothetical protein